MSFYRDICRAILVLSFWNKLQTELLSSAKWVVQLGEAKIGGGSLQGRVKEDGEASEHRDMSRAQSVNDGAANEDDPASLLKAIGKIASIRVNEVRPLKPYPATYPNPTSSLVRNPILQPTQTLYQT